MTDSKTPIPIRNSDDMQADEPFDVDFLSDSDSEFLGELDRVLTFGSDESEEDALSAHLEPLDLQLDVGGAEQDSTAGAAFELDGVNRVEVEAPPATQARDGLQESPQVRGSAVVTREAAITDPGVASAAREGMEPAKTVGGAKEVTPISPASIPPGNADRKSAAAARANGNRTGTSRSVRNPGTAPPPPGVSPVWLGVAAFLAIVGIGIGSAAIWLQMETDAHLAWMETKLAASAAPSRVEREASDERLQLLEQRLQEEVAGMRSLLEQRLGNQNERLHQDLDGLQSAMREVHGHLEAVQTQLADMEKRGNRPRQQTVKTSGARPVVRSGAARKAGDWVVNLISFRTRAKANKWVARLRDDDIQASVQVADHKGQTWYRLRVDGFSNFAQAKAFATEVRSEPDLSSAWVGRH